MFVKAPAEMITPSNFDTTSGVRGLGQHLPISVSQIKSNLSLIGRMKQLAKVSDKSKPISKYECSFKRRPQERHRNKTIGNIVHIVSIWTTLNSKRAGEDADIRSIYGSHGVPSQAEVNRVMEIPKKTIDDYILHVRYGKFFNFDFGTHRESRIGVLRRFVEEKRREQKKSMGVSKVGGGPPRDDIQALEFQRTLNLKFKMGGEATQ
uniref:Uncharacterized protein n=1 Tax=Strombidium rassoulzadegani TaxID=1082188 RepID=A0A7S3CQ69_9SPIT|mmetsp:Transcript_3704/g.6311  ORF Transcript_3704/g.6311 Transcript_3704/m.6311 type:complete len:207 (+) Transcript_3704:610-1230(+)